MYWAPGQEIWVLEDTLSLTVPLFTQEYEMDTTELSGKPDVMLGGGGGGTLQ